MKIFTFVFAFLMFSGMYSISNAQLMGSKTIPGDYPTIADAIAALNGQGVGTGGVTFNVISGHTEVSSNLVISIVNDPPSSSNL